MTTRTVSKLAAPFRVIILALTSISLWCMVYGKSILANEFSGSKNALYNKTYEQLIDKRILLAEKKKKKKKKKKKSEQDSNTVQGSSEIPPSAIPKRRGPPCTACKNLDGFVTPQKISDEIRLMVGQNRMKFAPIAVKIQKARGGIETGLIPDFLGGAKCPKIDSEKWAIDYSRKRQVAAIHKGIDIPQPRGTPVRAIAAGTVIGKFLNDWNRKGTEVMLRHTPDQTGIPFWTYSQYTHLREMSPLNIGDKVTMGQEIGTTSNTGKMGRRIRRDALHFAILYSKEPEWSNDGVYVVPKNSYWMDPNAFYKIEPPYNSQSLLKLPKAKKKIPVPYMKKDGSFFPENTLKVWPYACP